MTFEKFTQTVEIKFWGMVTPIMGEKGPIMKTRTFVYRLLHSKPGFMAVLALVWGAVGFVAGLLIGRVMGFFPL